MSSFSTMSHKFNDWLTSVTGGTILLDDQDAVKLANPPVTISPARKNWNLAHVNYMHACHVGVIILSKITFQVL